MRIAVISDSHGDFRHLGRLRAQLGRVDWLLHAGDHLQDAARIGTSLGVEPSQVRAVAGNCDLPLREPTQLVFELDGVRILMTHGHLHGVKDGLQRLQYRAQEVGARVAIFGHSHVALNLEEGGLLFFNPGSISSPRIPGERPSGGLLLIENGRVSAQHLYA